MWLHYRFVKEITMDSYNDDDIALASVLMLGRIRGLTSA